MSAPAPVLLRRRPIWVSPVGMSSSNLAFREGMRLREVVHADRAGLWCAVNGAHEPDLERLLQPGDIVDESTRPGGPESTAFSGLAPAFSFIAGLPLIVQLLGFSVLYSLIGRVLGPKERKDDRSTQYAWSGLHNNRIEGQPKAPIYGRLRVAPQVLDEFVISRNAQNESDLYALLGFGEGPIRAIGNVLADTDPSTPLQSDNPSNPLPTGIQINGNNLANLDGIEGHVRLGSNEQEPIPGFELVNTNYSVGTTLTQLETSDTSNAALNPGLDLTTVPYNSNSAGAQAVWDTYGATFDLTAAADQYGVVVEFPSGLYSITATGGVSDAYFQSLIRYKELDAGGSPINAGGDNGDGWVYVPPDVALISRSQQSFTHEFSGAFRAPQTFVPQALGRALDVTGASQFAATSGTPSLPASMAAGSNIDALTFVGWVRLNNLPSGTTAAHRPLIEMSSGGPSRGFGFGLTRQFFDIGGGGPIWAWAPTLHINSLLTEIHAPINGTVDNYAGTTPWFHLAFTYTLDDGTGGMRYRLYLNGVLVRTLLTTNTTLYRLVSSGGAIELMRSARLFTGANTYAPGLADEFVLDNREWTPTEVTQDYAFGAGRMNASSATLVAGWHFDDTSPADDFGPRGNSATVTGGLSGVTGGHVYTGATGALKKARYRVEVLRLNLKSTSQRIQDESVWRLLYGKLDDKLSYPNTPLLGLKIKATEQLNSTAPDYTVLVDGRLVPIWDGSAITYAWSQCPAWIALDVITNVRYGAGRDFSFDDVDLTAFKEWADYCDELVFDGRQYNRQSIDEGGTTSDVYDLRYDSTLFGGYGGIEVYFRVSPAIAVPPDYWTVGRFLGFTGIPPPAGAYAVDINTSNIGGFEIGSRAFTGGGWVIVLRYDRATLGDPWTDGQFLTTSLGATLTGVLEGREARFQCNYNPDTFSNVWDTLIKICQSARAMPLLVGGRITVRCERPRSTVALVAHASIKQGSFRIEYSDKIDQPNSYSCDFLDEDGNYARSTATLDDPALDATTSTDDLRRENIELEGVTRRSQVMRHLQYMLAVNRLLTQTIEFRSGLEQLALEAGDVFAIAHDIVPWGKSGRVATGSSTTSVFLDRDITLTAGTYYLRVRANNSGQTGSGTSVSDHIETVVVSSGAGTYLAGAPITVAAFTVAPAKDDLYVLYKEGEEFLAQVTEISFNETMEFTVRAVRYDAAVYDVDVLPGDLPDSMVMTSEAPLGQLSIPGHPTPAEPQEMMRLTSDGAWRSTFLLSWVNEPSTVRVLARTVLYARQADNGPWARIGAAEGAAQSFEWEPEQSVPGNVYEFALQPESTGGARQRPEACARIRGKCYGVSVAPDPPLAFTATMDMDRVTYTITPPANSRGLEYEIRRGGWILGQVVGVIPRGQTSITTGNWASGAVNARGEKQPILLVRSRDSRGQYSTAVALTTFDPVARGSTAVTYPTNLDNELYADQNWEDWGTGWVAGSATVTPAISGLQVATYSSRKVLEFSGANLTGTYTTALSTLASSPPVAPEDYYVEAFLVADQVPALLVSHWSLPLDDPRSGRRTIEGPLVVLDGEPANCTALIEWRWNINGTWGAWVPFEPGMRFMSQAQFRVTFTRPTTGYQVRAFRFHTRISRIAITQQQATSFIVENRTSDPVSPAVGRIWLRVDL